MHELWTINAHLNNNVKPQPHNLLILQAVHGADTLHTYVVYTVYTHILNVMHMRVFFVTFYILYIACSAHTHKYARGQVNVFLYIEPRPPKRKQFILSAARTTTTAEAAAAATGGDVDSQHIYCIHKVYVCIRVYVRVCVYAPNRISIGKQEELYRAAKELSAASDGMK